jgi:hypothetical protein
MFGVSPLQVTNGVCTNFNEWNQSIVAFAALKHLSLALEHNVDPEVTAHPYVTPPPLRPVKPEPAGQRIRNEGIDDFQQRITLYSALVNLYASELAIYDSEAAAYAKCSDDARTTAFLVKSRTMKLYLRESVDPLIASRFGPYETAHDVYAFLTREYGILTHITQGHLFRTYQDMRLSEEDSFTVNPIEFIQNVTQVLFQLNGTPYAVSDLMMRNTFVQNLSVLTLYREEFKKYRLQDLVDDDVWVALLAELRSTFELQKGTPPAGTSGYYAGRRGQPSLPPPASGTSGGNNWFSSATCTHCSEKGHPYYNCRAWRSANKGKWVENARVVDAKSRGENGGKLADASKPMDGSPPVAARYASTAGTAALPAASTSIPGF